jgi:hypothetical protein
LSDTDVGRPVLEEELLLVRSSIWYKRPQRCTTDRTDMATPKKGAEGKVE